MKLIKKIAAIMFAFMMVFSLSTNAKAETLQGSITINNAKKVKLTKFIEFWIWIVITTQKGNLIKEIIHIHINKLEKHN